MDVDAVLLSVQERDKWRKRLNLLQGSLDEVRGRQVNLQAQLRTIKRELGRLARFSDALLDQTTRRPGRGALGGAAENPIARR